MLTCKVSIHQWLGPPIEDMNAKLSEFTGCHPANTARSPSGKYRRNRLRFPHDRFLRPSLRDRCDPPHPHRRHHFCPLPEQPLGIFRRVLFRRPTSQWRSLGLGVCSRSQCVCGLWQRSTKHRRNAISDENMTRRGRSGATVITRANDAPSAPTTHAVRSARGRATSRASSAPRRPGSIWSIMNQTPRE